MCIAWHAVACHVFLFFWSGAFGAKIFEQGADVGVGVGGSGARLAGEEGEQPAIAERDEFEAGETTGGNIKGQEEGRDDEQDESDGEGRFNSGELLGEGTGGI